MNRIFKVLRNLPLAALVASPLALADDTDIYYSAIDGANKPLVMLTLDLRSNLGATQCANVTAASCRDFLGPILFNHLDLMTPDGDTFTYGPDGIVDSSQVGDVVDATAMRAAWDLAVGNPYGDSKVRLFDVLRAAFQYILNVPEVQAADLSLGMMLMHEHEQGCAGNDPENFAGLGVPKGCSGGAYVLKEFFDIGDPVELADFYKRMATVPTPTYTPLKPGGTWNGHTYQLNELYYEFYRYITGYDVYSGLLGYGDYGSVDHTTNLTEAGNDAPYGDWTFDQHVAPDPNAYEGETVDANYISPFEKGEPDDWQCAGLYMINTVFGVAQQDADADDAITDTAPEGLGLGNNPTQVDVISKLKDTDLASVDIGIDIVGDQGLTSFFLAATTNNTQNSWAQAGGTDYAISLGDGEEIAAALKALFDSIISESSSLVSASVPVNVFNRAETFENIFLSLFEAESGSRWPGNVKKLKLGTRTVDVVDPNGVLTGETNEVAEVQDTAGDPAFNVLDGRIEHSSLTFWTDPVGEDVTPEDCVDEEDPLLEDELCGTDGRSVQRGGAGQLISGFNTNDACFGDPEVDGPGLANDDGACARKLYTEDPDTGELMPFDADATTAADLASYFDPNTPDAVETETLIKWARGVIELDNTLTEVEAAPQRWMMGDVLHGKPLPMNYGDTDGNGGYDRDNPDVRLYFGSNDGWFRSVRNTNPDGSESGEEVGAFMPLEVMGIQKDLARDIAPSTGHPYGVDGDITALIVDRDSDGNIENGVNDGLFGDADDGDKVFLFFGLRRGGNAYYGLDVSDPDSAPKLMFKIDNDAAGDFPELAMSWSAPRVAIVNYDGARKPVLVFGGGYNGGWNADGDARIGKDEDFDDFSKDDVGNAIYVADALTGDLVWKTVESGAAATEVYVESEMDYSIPSDITLLDSDQNGVTDMAYVGDMGGNVWRIDMPESSGAENRDNWTTTRLAKFGGGGDDDRRFFHAPDIVFAKDEVLVDDVATEREYIGIIISSGNRAHPKEDKVDNFMYYLKDPLTIAGAATGDRGDTFKEGEMEDITTLCDTPEDCDARDLENGWMLELEESGEKGLASAVTIQGTIFFTTYLPKEGGAEECATGLGGGRLYAVKVSDGSPAFNLSGDSDDITEADRYTDLDTPGIPPETPPIAKDGEFGILRPDGEIREIEGRFKWKVYWRERGVDEI